MKVKFGDKQVEVWGFDTETIKGQPYTFQLSFGDKRIYYENVLGNSKFREAFFKTIFKECEDGAIIFSYNLFFEITVLFRDKVELLSKNRFKWFTENYFVEGMVENPTPRMVLYGKNKKIYFVDASRFFTGDRKIDTLEKVANSYLEVPKMKRPKYIGERKPKRNELEYFKKYSMIDAYLAEKLGEIIIEYHNLVNIKEVTFSISHLAGKAFKQNYTDGKGLDLANDQIENYADEARRGGYRAAHVGEGVYRDICHIDLDSAYPFAMSILPAFYGGKFSRCNSLNDYGLFKIKTKLPLSDRPYFQKKIYSQSGKSVRLEFIEQEREVVFWTTGFEIKNFKSIFKEWKYEILSGYIWKGQSKYKPMKAWVEFWHKRKIEIDKDDKKRAPERQFAKLMMNVISGKADSVIFERESYWITKDGIEENGTTINGSLKNYFVATLIRAIPRSICWKTGFETESLFEVTDSISIERKYLKKINIENKLGGWGFETGKKFKTDLVFEKLGTYFYFPQRGKLKKGPVKYALQGFHQDWKTYFQLLKKGVVGSYQKLRMNKIKESLRQNKPEKVLTFEKKTWNWEISANYRKAVLKWLKK